MYRGKSVAVVITAYNEEEFVGNVIDQIPQFVDRIYAVDDASTDGTWAKITERAETRSASAVSTESPARPQPDGGEELPTVVPFRHEENQGVGATIKTGYRAAMNDEIDVTAVINGDGQMDPSILDRIIDPVVAENADYSKGNRLASRGHVSEMPRWRLTGNVLLTFLTRISSGYWKMNDPQNGYTAISLGALQRIDIESLYDSYGFLNNLLVTLNTHGCRIADVEMEAIYGDEESGIRYSTFIPGIVSILARSFFWRLNIKYVVSDFHPLVLFYLLGGLGLGLGFCAVGWALLLAELPGLSMLISICLVMFSSSLILRAITLDMQANASLENTLQ